MNLEVELKFTVANSEAIRSRLEAIGTVLREAVIQHDTYYSHPSRDFCRTDEALRIRRSGTKYWVTYKGPRVDVSSQTRHELELALPEQPPQGPGLDQLLIVLGFSPVAVVRKTRHAAQLVWRDRDCSICLDHVDDLGSFVELETHATPAELIEARDDLTSLAKELGLTESEHRSYLELIADASAA